MYISYEKLWNLLEISNMKKGDLQKVAKMSSNTMAKLGRNETISMEIILRICKALHCDISEIMEVHE